MTDLIVTGTRITTLDPQQPSAEAFAIRDGKFSAVGRAQDVLALAQEKTQVLEVGDARVIPGLIDSHIHVIRGGLSYNLEVHWEGVRSLADAMDMLRAQVAVTPPPQWVRVVGGFCEAQFDEKRLPTLAELNALAPDTPIFILHLYDRALLNQAALRACGYTKDTPDPPGGRIERDGNGHPTGLLLAKPNALILYASLAKGPKLPPEYQLNSTRHFLRELNRLGVTSVIDAGGGFQNYPEDYQVIQKLADDGELTLRIAYNLFTQRNGLEAEDFSTWAKLVRPGDGSDSFRHNGAGEMLVFSAADFEDFREPRPELSPNMEGQLETVVRILVENRWPWRLHATYDESIERALTVFEKVNREMPFEGLHWFFDHAETISRKNIDRTLALGGGVAIQHRMMFQGEAFRERYGQKALERTPPLRWLTDSGIPLGAGTDATRVASYNPWVSLSWLIAGRTLGGLQMYPPAELLSRHDALRLWTAGNAWFSDEEGKKGQIQVGQLADFAVLNRDYFSIPVGEIQDLWAILTVLGGRVVHAAGPFAQLAPPLVKAMPDWSPVRTLSKFHEADRAAQFSRLGGQRCQVHGVATNRPELPVRAEEGFWGALGCSCWAF